MRPCPDAACHYDLTKGQTEGAVSKTVCLINLTLGILLQEQRVAAVSSSDARSEVSEHEAAMDLVG